MKNYFFYLLVLFFFIIFIIIGEEIDAFSSIKKKLQYNELPSVHLNRGKRGMILGDLGNFFITPDDDKKPVKIFDSRKHLTLSNQKFSVQKLEGLKKHPFDQVSHKESLYPTININIDPEDLYSKESGIVTNFSQKGREWERICYLNAAGNNLIYNGYIGLRLHGRASRTKFKYKNFRIYFRSEYETTKPGSELLLGKHKKKLKCLVLRTDQQRGKTGTLYNYANLISLDIAKQIGCMAPDFSPIKLTVNDQLFGTGQYYLIERIDKEFFYNRFGKKKYYYYSLKDEEKPKKYIEFEEWILRNESKLNISRLSKRLEVDSFINWWISSLFCGTRDYLQGTFYKEKKDPQAKWKIINWDMDMSFLKTKSEAVDHNWQQEYQFYYIFRETNQQILAVILRSLIKNDPQFYDLVNKRLSHVLDNRLNTEFLNNLLSHYIDAGKECGVYFSENNIQEFKDYFKNRKKVLPQLLKKYLDQVN